jgi:hypothetical protein
MLEFHLVEFNNYCIKNNMGLLLLGVNLEVKSSQIMGLNLAHNLCQDPLMEQQLKLPQCTLKDPKLHRDRNLDLMVRLKPLQHLPPTVQDLKLLLVVAPLMDLVLNPHQDHNQDPPMVVLKLLPATLRDLALKLHRDRNLVQAQLMV